MAMSYLQVETRDLSATIKALAEGRGIARNLRFSGERSDVPQLLAAADFGLLTSHEEGFSNVILEGMGPDCQ